MTDKLFQTTSIFSIIINDNSTCCNPLEDLRVDETLPNNTAPHTCNPAIGTLPYTARNAPYDSVSFPKTLKTLTSFEGAHLLGHLSMTQTKREYPCWSGTFKRRAMHRKKIAAWQLFAQIRPSPTNLQIRIWMRTRKADDILMIPWEADGYCLLIVEADWMVLV